MWRLTFNLLLCVLAIHARLPQPIAYPPEENNFPGDTTVPPVSTETVPPTTTPAPPKCPSPFELVGDQCLYFASFAEQSHQECRQICHSLSGQLVTVKTATQMKNVIDLINTQGLEHKGFWTDATDIDEEGNWVYTSGDSVPMGTPFWATSEDKGTPDDTDHTQNCGEIIPLLGYLLNDNDCNGVRSPLCEHELVSADGGDVESPPETKNVECPPFFVDVDGSCFAFITWADQDWFTARQTCHGLDGDLAIINDIDVLRSIYEYLGSEGIDSHSFWTGGSDAAEENTWVWTDGSDVPKGTPFWGNSATFTSIEPDGGDSENCLALTSAGKHYFRDKDCMMPLNPLCSAEPL